MSKKRLAIKLRKQGYSYSEIAVKLLIPKSTTSGWLRDISMSKNAVARIAIKRKSALLKSMATHRHQRLERIADAERFSRQTINSLLLDENHKLLICSLIYFCEGSKGDGEVRFTNSDPYLITLFMRLLRQTLAKDESKFRVCIHLHDYHNKRKQLQFWSKVTKIHPSQFIKPYRKKHTGLRKREGYQGCVDIRYHDCGVARKLLSVARTFMKRYGRVR